MRKQTSEIMSIYVYGTRPITPTEILIGKEGRMYYRIDLKIVKILDSYIVLCYVDNKKYYCGSYKSEEIAKKILKVCMKKAMKNRLLYRKCIMCRNYIEYPSDCIDCPIENTGSWLIMR